MNLLSKKLTLALLGASVLFAGCPKKPKRPDPSATVLGPGEGGLGMTAVDGGANSQVADANSMLSAREGVIETADQIRGLLQPVYFDFDRSAVKPEERSKIQAAADYLKNTPNHRLLIEGSCDWRGTKEYNLALGDRRAAAVKAFIQTLGIDAGRVEVLSKGDLEAVEGNDEAQLSRDRRAEIVILKK